MSVLVAVCLLMLAGMAIMEGPHNFFQTTNRAMINGAERVVLWLQARW